MSCFMPGQTVRTKADAYVVVVNLEDAGTFTPSEGRGLSRKDADAFAYTLFQTFGSVEVKQRIDVTILSGIAKPKAYRCRVTEYPVIDGWSEWETVTSYLAL
jgi:hypothetical protein